MAVLSWGTIWMTAQREIGTSAFQLWLCAPSLSVTSVQSHFRSESFFPNSKGLTVKQILLLDSYPQEKKKTKQLGRAEQSAHHKCLDCISLLLCTKNEVTSSFGAWLVHQSLKRWSVWESLKSSIAAAVCRNRCFLLLKMGRCSKASTAAESSGALHGAEIKPLALKQHWLEHSPLRVPFYRLTPYCNFNFKVTMRLITSASLHP